MNINPHNPLAEAFSYPINKISEEACTNRDNKSYPFMKKIYIAAIIFCFINVAAYAQRTVEYHPDSPAALGRGYDPNKPQELYVGNCVESDGIKDIDLDPRQSGVVSADIEIKEINSYKELASATGISLSVEAGVGFYSGSSSFSQKLAVNFESTSLIWVASTNINYGRRELVNPRASNKLSGAPTPSDVLRVCGSEVFTQETRGAIAVVVFELRNLSSTKKSELSLALSASKSGPGPNGSFDSKFSSLLTEIQNTSQLHVLVHVEGGPGPGVLHKIIESPSDLRVVRTTLAEYNSKTNINNAKPLRYQTSSINQFKKAEYTVAPNLDQDRLWEIYEQYLNLTNLVRRIDQLIKPTSKEEAYLYAFVSQQDRKYLQSIRVQYEKARKALRDAGVGCLKGNSNCEMPDISELPRAKWPNIPEAITIGGKRKCKVNILQPLVYGPHVPPTPPAKGTVIGKMNYELVLIGEPQLYESAWFISEDSRIPIEMLTPQEVEKQNKEYVSFSPDKKYVSFSPDYRMTSFADCETRSVNNKKIVGYLYIFIELKSETSQGKIEVLDKYGRRTYFDLDSYK